MSQPGFIQNARYEGGRKCPYSTSETIETDRYLDAKETQGFLNFYTYFLSVSVSICLYIHTIIHTYQIVRNM